MCDDSFDFEELETLTAQPTVTAWSAQVASRPKSVRIYGRRGSTGALPRSSHSRPAMRFKTSRIEQQLDCLSPTDEEKEFGQISDIENRNLPVFRPDVPKVPGRRRFTRANSMGAGSSGQKSDHIIRRSASVTHSNDFSSATSTKSSSVSSNMDMFSETGAENIHPNWVPLDEHISPKRLACPLEMRGRKKVRSAKNLTSMDQPQATSHAASCSFSNIAREESLTWAKPVIQQTEGVSFPSTHSFNELEFLEASSPAMSSVCSNRKRGICESPFDDIDDCQSVGSLSISRVSTCRSRLLSPPSSYEKAEFHLDMNDKLNKFIQNKDKHMKKSPLMDITSDEGESGVDSSEGMDSDDEVSLDGNTNRRSPVPTFVPFNERQKKRSSVPIFPDTTRRVKVLQPATASVDDIIHSMASYQDLKYLVKSLRGQREGSVCWHVALPNVWGETQRRGFMLWITNDLGFTHRKAGAQASYFQIPKSKGVVILKLLEVSIKVCKDQGIGTTSPINVSPATSHFIFGASAHQKALQGADKTNDNNMARYVLTSTGFVPFTNGIIHLPFQICCLSITTTGMIFPEATTHLDSDLMKALVSFGMDDKATHIPTVFAGKPSIMVEDTYETSMRDPRHSMENPSSSRDLMAHMNGLTPNPTRPPRLSTESVSTQGTISKFNIASPYPQPSLCSIGSHLKCFTNEFLETPMMKPAGWGSCPIDGRDWGTSEGCHELISHSLLGMLEWACHEAGTYLSNLHQSIRIFSFL